MRVLLLLAALPLLTPEAVAQPRTSSPRQRALSPRAAVAKAAPQRAAVAGWPTPAGARAAGAVYTVTSAADTNDGVCDAADCTFVEALEAANAAEVPATIQFQINGGGGHRTIVIEEEYPALFVPLVIDGDTQGCADRAAGPCITFDASGLPDGAFDVLFVAGGDSEIRNLHFVGAGLDAYSEDSFFSAIDLASSGNVVAGCVVGADRGGATADPDGQPGTGDELGFVFGVNVLTFVGDPDPPATENRIGGPAPEDRNVILGNEVGIAVLLSSANTVENNVVSGNAQIGIGLSGGSTDNVVVGNLVGLDRTGTQALPNGDPSYGPNSGNGIQIDNGGLRNRIGGPGEADANVVSGNLNAGIVLATLDFDDPSLAGAVSENLIEGNLIGTDATGLAAIPNGTVSDPESGAGVALVSDPTQGGVLNNTVRNNVISGNRRIGVLFDGSATTKNVADGNLIGVGIDGRTALPNGQVGVGARNGAATNRAGSEAAPNVIAFHPIGAGATDAVTGFSVAENTFVSNQIEIDLGLDGATANDAGDADEGPNRRLNAPVIESAALAGGQLRVSLRLDAPPATAAYPVAVTVYGAESGAAGRTLRPLGVVVIPQGQAGPSTSGAFDASGPVGHVVAVATDADGNTSEVGTASVAVAGEAVTGVPAGGLRLTGPNPFQASTALALVASTSGPVRVDVVDALGRTVAVLHDGPVVAGTLLDLRLVGAELAPGVYAVRATGAVSAVVRAVRAR